MSLPTAAIIIGAITLIALLFQISLLLRYWWGASRLRRWGERMLALPDSELAQALVVGTSSTGWMRTMIRDAVAALGITTGAFRIEHALSLLEESEDHLFRHTFVKYCLGAMMVFGLAGTFFAFIHLISASGLTDALEAIANGGNVSERYSELSASFLMIYDGFGQAFISSLAGLVSTLVLILAEQVFVAPARIRLVHRWASLAHDWERRLNPEHKEVSESLATDESAALATSQYAPVAAVPAPTPSDSTANQEKWEVLVKSLEDSRAFFDNCLTSLAETGLANREEMQKLVAEVVVSMRQVVADLGNQVSKVSDAKAEHLKKVEDNIQEHFTRRERIWQDKMQETLDAFRQTLQESANQSQSTLDNTRKDSLEAGERVAKAVQREAQAALGVITSNQNAVLQTKQELLHAIGGVAALVSSVTQLIQENKQSVESYISELTLSLRPWKNAPKSVDDALKKTNELQGVLADAIKKMSSALERAAQIPNRWDAEIKDLSELFGEFSERKRADSMWNQLQSKTKDSTARIKAWFQGGRR